MKSPKFKRSIILITTLLLVFQVFLLISSLGWAQMGSISPPLRTYALSIPPDEVWIIVSKAVAEVEFTVHNEDPLRFKMTAIGEEYEVPVGFSTKRERQHITITVEQKRPGLFDLYVDIKVMEFWPTDNRWTTKTHDVDTTTTLMVLARSLNQKLKPYRQVISR